MQNKKTILIMGGVVLLVGAAAFVAGRMLNNQVNPLGLFGLGGKRGVMEVSINLIPAKELPKTEPVMMGLFAERKDKTILVQSTSLKTGGKGIVVHKGEDGSVSPSSNMNYGPKIEVLITNDTTIYRDTTQPGEPSTNETQTVQQTVEESTLDDLSSQSQVMVWGRKSGDRIIAEVLLYSNPVLFERPGP
jgi:hypothetical protein